MSNRFPTKGDLASTQAQAASAGMQARMLAGGTQALLTDEQWQAYERAQAAGDHSAALRILAQSVATIPLEFVDG